VGVLFQDVRVFRRMTTMENLLTAARYQPGENPLIALLAPTRVRVQDRELATEAMRHLEYVGLADKAHVWADHLSYGQQKLLGIARLLMSDARVLLLDEPISGVSPTMTGQILRLIQKMADTDHRTVVMIEHNLNVVREVGDWVFLMARGAIEVFGKPEEVLHDRALWEIFPNL
jgi:ABC-type branched-subunit amino acid transport system ATPase component